VTSSTTDREDDSRPGEDEGPLVSVIVPCFNSERFLAHTIESVVRQGLAKWELILVDDGSADSTWAIISEHARGDPRISGHQQRNGGTCAARNHGFSKTDGRSRYLMFLDHDDALAPDALGKMSSYLGRHPQVGLVACQFEDIGVDGRALGTGGVDRWVPGTIFPRRLGPSEFPTPFVTFFCATGQGPFAMYRRSAYVKTSGWDTGFWPHEDTDMFCQMALEAEVHFLPDRLYHKRVHPNQGMSDNARTQRAYAAFRAKWDCRIARTEGEARVLKEAREYYYDVYRPCRSLKIAVRALAAFCRHPTPAGFRWFRWLAGAGISGLLLNRLRRRWKRGRE
jgi:glycosyltransferase involved in cell wall biosynthesis